MSSRNEIRKRIAKRKRERERESKTYIQTPLYIVDEEEKYGVEKLPRYEVGSDEGGHPLFNKDIFLFKVMGSACLVLLVALLFRNNSDTLQPIKSFVTKSMEEEFQFTAISEWYEDQFGKPLALFPLGKDDEAEIKKHNQEYALPAAARILEEFGEDGQKITIETELGAPVTAMSEGRVRFIGQEDGFGKTVIIQHGDKSETWYGNLASVNVSLYEYVKKGSSVGMASEEDEAKGTFFFAIKKGDDFIDPIRVIQFD